MVFLCPRTVWVSYVSRISHIVIRVLVKSTFLQGKILQILRQPKNTRVYWPKWHPTPMVTQVWHIAMVTALFVFMNLIGQDFHPLQSPILIPLSWPITGSDKSGWDHVAGESVLSHLLLLRRSLSAGYDLHFINAEWPLSYFMVWDSPSVNETLPQSLKKFYVSKKCLYFNKTSFHDFVPFEVISHFYSWYLVSSWNPTITKDSNVPFKNKKWDAAVNATHLLIRLSIKCHFFAILNLCYVMVDTVQTSISIQYNAYFATAALKNHLEWEEIVKFKTITTDIKRYCTYAVWQSWLTN